MILPALNFRVYEISKLLQPTVGFAQVWLKQ